MPKRPPRRAAPAVRSPPRRAKPKPAKPAQIAVSADELAALYEELEGLRAELARVGTALTARDYELRTALAELEILRLRVGAGG